MSMKRAFLAVFAVAVLCLNPSYAGEKMKMPDPKDHEFNTNIPTKFSGMDMTMSSEDAGNFHLYMSGPMNAKNAILMIHEWWGLNAHMKGVADQLGRIGYAVYAIDLFDGKATDDAEKAAEQTKAVDMVKALAKLKTALVNIKKAHKKVGTIGWCFGGGYSLKASLAEPVDATVIYYGSLENDPQILSRLKGPVLGIFAKRDKWITPEVAAAFEKGLREAKVKHEIKSFDADHAFANPSGQRFMLAPAREAWSLTLKFFEANLK